LCLFVVGGGWVCVAGVCAAGGRGGGWWWGGVGGGGGGGGGGGVLRLSERGRGYKLIIIIPAGRRVDPACTWRVSV